MDDNNMICEKVNQLENQIDGRIKEIEIDSFSEQSNNIKYQQLLENESKSAKSKDMNESDKKEMNIFESRLEIVRTELNNKYQLDLKILREEMNQKLEHLIQKQKENEKIPIVDATHKWNNYTQKDEENAVQMSIKTQPTQQDSFDDTMVAEFPYLVEGIKPDESFERNLDKKFEDEECNIPMMRNIVDYGKDSENFSDLSPTLYAFSIFIATKKHWSLVWIMVSLSFFFMSLQILVVHNIVLESAHPTCTSHTDCPLGEYCSSTTYRGKVIPRCRDCSNLDSIDLSESCSSYLDEVKPWDYTNLDHKYLLYNRNIDPTDEKSLCLSNLHCLETDIMPDKCDHYELNRDRMTYCLVVSLVFIAVIGLAPILNNDVEEARAEEILLDYVTRSKLHALSWIAAQFIYFSLRIRRYSMPVFAALSTAAIILANTFSVQNILLNVLSITFLLEIDNVAVAFLLPPKQLKAIRELMDEALESSSDMNKKYGPIIPRLSWLWSRIISVSAVIVMILTIMTIGVFGDCDDFYVVFFSGFGLVSGSFYTLHSIGVFCFSLKRYRICQKAFMSFALDSFRNLVAFSYIYMMYFLFGAEAELTIYLDDYLKPLLFTVLSFAVMFVILLFIEENCPSKQQQSY